MLFSFYALVSGVLEPCLSFHAAFGKRLISTHIVEILLVSLDRANRELLNAPEFNQSFARVVIMLSPAALTIPRLSTLK